MEKFITIFTLIMLPLLIKCSTPYPQMPHSPETYIAKPSENAICRLVKKEEHKIEDCVFYLDYDVAQEVKCILTNCASFSNYQCVSKQDMAMVQQHITNLIDSCETWK